jgi:hypothetical protein
MMSLHMAFYHGIQLQAVQQTCVYVWSCCLPLLSQPRCCALPGCAGDMCVSAVLLPAAA